jgi:GTP pyrophosphokinase
MTAEPDPASANVLGERFEDALRYAAHLHADQSRKGSGSPYVAHLLGVAALVLEEGGDEDQAIAALLHDAVEDQGGLPQLEAIRARFGERVAAIVLGCTDTDTWPKPPWRERKEAYLAHLPHAAPEVWLVSLADKVYNARSILRDLRANHHEIWSRFKGGREGSLWYYHALADAFGRLMPNSALVIELRATLAEIERIG